MKKIILLIFLSFFLSEIQLPLSDFDNQAYGDSHKKKKKKGKKKGMKKNWKIDLTNIVVKSNCLECESIKGFIDPYLIDRDIYIMLHLGGSAERGQTKEDVDLQKERGGIKTGTKPVFYNNAKCGKIDEGWAINYTQKRNNPAIHKGIDIPKPFGEPIVAVANGTVIGIFENSWSAKGIEIMLRHTPEQTGLPFWTYSQYTHFEEMPNFEIGQKVSMGEVLGPTGNTGKRGKESDKKKKKRKKVGKKRPERRPAIHFAIIYSEVPEWSSWKRGIVVKDGYWMDPLAFYKNKGPYKSQEVKKLSKKEKKISIGYKKNDGSFVPEDTIKIWPYICN